MQALNVPQQLLHSYQCWPSTECVSTSMLRRIDLGDLLGHLVQCHEKFAACCRQCALGPEVPRQRDDGASAVLHLPPEHHGGHIRGIRGAAPVAAPRPEEALQGARQGHSGRGGGVDILASCLRSRETMQSTCTFAVCTDLL